MNSGLIFSIVFLACAALAVFFGVIKGSRYTWLFSAARIIGVISSAVLATVVSVFGARLLASYLDEILAGVLPQNINDLIAEMPEATVVVEGFISILLAPIFFIPLFLGIYHLTFVLLKLLVRLLVKLLPSFLTGVSRDPIMGKRRHNQMMRVGKKTNIAGKILGGAAGFLICCVIFIPLVGMTTTLDRVGDTVDTLLQSADGELGAEGEIVETVLKEVDSVAASPAAMIIRTLGGDLVYHKLTTYQSETLTISMNDELEMVESVANAVSVYRDPAKTPADAGKAIRDVEPAFDRSNLLPIVGADLLHAAATHWDNGEDFLGYHIDMTTGYGKVIKPVAHALKDTDEATFKEDTGTLIHLVATIVEQEALSDFGSNPVGILSKEALMEDVLYELLVNPRLYPVVASVLDMGIEKMAASLAIKQNEEELYVSFCEKLNETDRVSDYTPEGDVVQMGTANEIPDEAIQQTVTAYRKLLASFGVTVEEELLAQAALASADPEEDMVKWFEEHGVMSLDIMKEKNLLIVMTDLEISSTQVQDPRHEAKQLSSVLSELMHVMDKVSAGEHDITVLIDDIGTVLDAFSDTEMVGEEKCANLLTAMLQSEQIAPNIGFSVAEATKTAASVNQNAQKSNYSTQMKSMAKTFDVMREASKSENKTDKTESLKELLTDLTPESASTMQTVMVPSVVMQHGVPEKNAEPVSNMMSDMFGNLSNAKEEGMSEEEIEKETLAVNNVINMTMGAGNANGKAFGEGSLTGSSAEQVIAEVMDSTVISNTVVEQIYGENDEVTMDPLKTERQLDEEEEGQLLDALNQHWNNASDEEKNDEEYQKKLAAIAAFLNVQVTVGENGVSKVAQ